VYPDFSPLADVLLTRHSIASDTDLADLLLRRYGVGVLPASAFGEDAGRLRLRVATGLLYGDSEAQRAAALDAVDALSADPVADSIAGSAASRLTGPCALPWINDALARLGSALADLLD
jgi:aspartate aminotransferase